MNKVYLMDCVEGMRNTADGYYDLAVVDPPYGIGQPKQSNLKGYNGRPSLEDRIQKNRLNGGSGKLKNRVLNTSNCEWDNAIPSDEYFNELFRISKDQIIWGGNYFGLPATRCVICWDKMQPWENFSQIELAWTSFDSPAQIYKFDNRTGGKIHPTQKPIALYDWIFTKYATKGMKILDTHAGSMSSVISAMKNEMQITAYEIDSDYFNAGKKRIETYLMQGDMFNQPKIEFIS